MSTILLVDDNPENLYLLQSLFESNDINSISASNGKEALELALKNPPDIIISDILMPVMDGYSFCRQCKLDSTLKNIPFIFYTATYTDKKDQEYALSLGAARFILKPQEPQAFLEIIHNVIAEVKHCSFHFNQVEEIPETIVFKGYNETLIRKLESKMLHLEKTEKLLETQYALLLALINSPKDTIIFSLDNKYCYTAFNEKHQIEMKRVWDVDIELGTNLLNCMSNIELKELAKQSIDRALNGESFSEVQHQPDLDIFYEFSWNPIIQSDLIIGVTVFIRDITIRTKAEASLQQSEEKYHFMFLNNPQPMWIYDLNNFSFLEVNDAAIQHYGYTKEEFLCMTLKDIRPLEDVPLLIKDLEIQHNNLNQSGIWRHTKKNGEIIFVEITSHQITFDNRPARHVLVHDITEKIKVKESLKISEEKYRNIFENVQDVFYQVGLDGTILDISPSIKHYSDYSRNELIGSQIADLYYDSEDRMIFLKNIQAKGELRDYELRLKSKSGATKYASINAMLICDAFGKPNHIDGSIRDITNRKLAEHKLQLSEEKMRMIVEGTPYLFFYVQDTSGKINYISPSVENITGYSLEDWYNRNDWFITKNKINDIAKERTLTHLRGEFTSGSILVEIEHKAKNNILLEVYENPIVIDGVVIGLQGVAHDITERKHAENELRKLSRAIEQSPVSVLITNMHGNIVYVNKKLCNITGYTRDDLIGENPKIFKSGFQDQFFYKELWSTINSGFEWSGEMLNRKKDGELFWESVLISPLVNSNGEIINYVAIKEDISEKKKMISELIEAKNHAEEMNRLKSYFMSNMSHELRTPLVGILGISEFMIEELEDECKENAKIINISGKRLLKTISEILDISKLEAEKVTLNYSLLNLTQILQDEIALYSKAAATKNIAIVNQCENENILINSDERLLREIFDNLINNAVKFTNQGLVTVSVELTDDHVVVSVSDTGMGIPSDKLDYIFEEFRQVSEGISRNFEGTGLGLTIVKKFVMLLNGKIEVKSEVNIGSSFIVSLPLGNFTQLPAANKNILINLQNEILNSPHKLSILLVEDDSINNEVIQLMITNFHNVFSVDNAEDAIKASQNQSFDLILMDINLKRGMNGIEAAQLIRNISGYENIPIVAMTAYASASDRDEFLNSGCSHYISKPFSQKDILLLLESIVK
ncbi:MAG: hypothetical protein C0412_09975 [Flavobacterium sp.]|nr:hypothetical protein [Flavobacterium sp.]